MPVTIYHTKHGAEVERSYDTIEGTKFNLMATHHQHEFILNHKHLNKLFKNIDAIN